MTKHKTNNEGLKGKMIVTNPYSNFNDYFSKCVILIDHHDKHGAYGYIVNKITATVPVDQFFNNLEFKTDKIQTIKIGSGGPIIENASYFLMHDDRNDMFIARNLREDMDNEMAHVMLNACLHRKDGNEMIMTIKGYTGWGEGQLEQEVADNHWLIMDYDPEIAFCKEMNPWDKALEKSKINPVLLIGKMSHS